MQKYFCNGISYQHSSYFFRYYSRGIPIFQTPRERKVTQEIKGKKRQCSTEEGNLHLFELSRVSKTRGFEQSEKFKF